MPKVLFINPGWEQQPLINRLVNHFGCKLYGVFPPDSNIETCNRFTEILCADLFDIESIVEFAKSSEIQAVISDQCDYSLYTQSMVASLLNLPGPSPESAYLSNNKYLQRVKALDAGILIPRFRLCYSTHDALEFASIVGYPVVLKPVDNRGSIGVVRVNSSTEIDAALVRALTCSRSQLVLVEEYIDGIQFTVDGYVAPGTKPKTLAIGEKIMLSDQIQVAMGISYPASLPEPLYYNLSSLNESVNARLGYIFGMIHSEYMCRDGQFYLIESSNRGGGCLTSEIVVPEVTGLNLIDQYICNCLDVSSSVLSSESIIGQNSVTLRFFSLPEGRFDGIANWKTISESKQCLFSRINASSGDLISSITSDANRHGFLIVAGNNKDAMALINMIKTNNA